MIKCLVKPQSERERGRMGESKTKVNCKLYIRKIKFICKQTNEKQDKRNLCIFCEQVDKMEPELELELELEPNSVQTANNAS